MLERQFQTKFFHWLEKNPPNKSAAYEFKVTNGKTFNLKQWLSKSPQQARGLASAKFSWMYHKISDQSMGAKPFDAFVLSGADSFLVVWFNTEKEFCVLPITYVMGLIDKGKNVNFSELPIDSIKKFQ